MFDVLLSRWLPPVARASADRRDTSEIGDIAIPVIPVIQ
ncbi:hypothetical protein HSB1_23600 [Halogranum salarium B-1]|uniref:Uncharacterized protein n=1 Tax=Halogranum salarium B-1 TaxID=1210908 RepID=J3JF46_9EURY|nr:hypothetical protein HSB1_23600 [Halogranum salarium B-1]